MKKTIALILSAILLIGLLAGCGESAPKTAEGGTDPTGTWTCIYTKFVGDTAKTAEKYTLDLNAGGTGVHHRDGSDFDVTWKLDGENFSCGFLDICDSPYWELVEAAREVGAEMYPLRYGASRKPPAAMGRADNGSRP